MIKIGQKDCSRLSYKYESIDIKIAHKIKMLKLQELKL